MAKSNGLSKYAEKYLDTQFKHLHEEIKGVSKEVKGVKLEMKKNGKCLHKIEKTMAVYKFRFKWLTFAVVGIVFVLILGVLNGVELITKGVLSFVK